MHSTGSRSRDRSAADRPRARHHLRLQRRRGCRRWDRMAREATGRQLVGRGPFARSHHPRRAGVRLSEGSAPAGGSGQRDAATAARGAVRRDRRPRRAARRSGADRRRAAQHQALVRRYRDLLDARDPGQRDRDRPDRECTCRQGGAHRHRPAGAGARLRPPRTSRTCQHVPLDPARDRDPGAWRGAASRRAGPVRDLGGRRPRRSSRRTAP